VGQQILNALRWCLVVDRFPRTAELTEIRNFAERSEPHGGTVTTSAYNERKKRCLSAEAESGNPRKKVSEQNSTFTRDFCKSSHRLSLNEIRAEAHKRQSKMRDAAVRRK
jgi:hypothetical protein